MPLFRSSAGLVAFVFLIMGLATAQDLSGTYRSSFGELRLHQVGDYLIGDYADRGVMVGKLSGGKVAGGFTNGTRAGQFSFTFDGEAFDGTFTFAGSSTPSAWSGERTGNAPSALLNFSLDGSPTRTMPNARDVFDGVYDSSFGRVELIQQDLFLIGDYGSQGVIAGMWDGDSFVGRFTNGARAGWFDFRFLSRTGSFRDGTWGWEVGSSQGVWTLTEVEGAAPQIDLSATPTVAVLRPGSILTIPGRTVPDRLRKLEVDPSTSKQGVVKSAMLVLPGDTSPTEVFYEVIDGIAYMDGDIILGAESELKSKYAAPAPEIPDTQSSNGLVTRRQPLNVLSNLEMLWPNGVIPYDFARNVPDDIRANVIAGAERLTRETNLTIVPRDGQRDFVRIRAQDEGCSAELGRQGRRQRMTLESGCGEVVVMHEFLHAAGFTHEQQRRDRDQHVQIRLDKVEDDKDHNFKTKKDSTSIGPYDFGSVMHYPDWAFQKDDCTADCETILPRTPLPAGVTMGQRDGLSANDVAGVNFVYPARIGFEGGLDWGQGSYPTAVATGDVDGDGSDEFVIARRAPVNGRVIVYDYVNGQQRVLKALGTDWGDSFYATDVALGDVDGDGRDEIAVARYATSNGRYFVFDDAQADYRLLYTGGTPWGDGAWATAVAFGDVDGDGREELAVGRRSPVNQRYALHDDRQANFAILARGGTDWGDSASTTGLAFGDVDNDGRDELGITRRHGSNARFFVDDYANGSLRNIFSGGEIWGSGGWGTSIAFGNVDGDPHEEMLVGRRSPVNARFYLFDDRARGFASLEDGGEVWGDGYWTIGVDLADFDDDGKDELLVGRNAGENDRIFIYDDAGTGYAARNIATSIWPARVGATDVAYGDLDGDGDQDVVVTRRETIRGRTRFEVIIAQ